MEIIQLETNNDDEGILEDDDLSQYEVQEDGKGLSLTDKTKALADITVSAIKDSRAFSDVFDNPVPISCYGNSEFERLGKPEYIIFRANDAVNGRRVVVKCTNPIFTTVQADGGRACETALEWEEAAIRLLDGKKRCVVLNSGVQSVPIQCHVGGDIIRDRVTFLSTMFLPFDVKKCFSTRTGWGKGRALSRPAPCV